MTLYTPDLAGSGQFGICAKCNLPPTDEGHDGCLGTLPGPIMNACCGHGNDNQAYIQYWGGLRVSGGYAIEEQNKLKNIIDQIDWNRAPIDATHAILEDGFYSWEMLDGDSVYTWSGEKWLYYMNSDSVPFSFRIERPANA